MNTVDEKRVFQIFKENYRDFPVGEEIYQDKPDYVVNTADGLIGIEITEAVIDPLELERHEFQVSITNDVLKKLKNKLPFIFCISLYIKKGAKLPKKKREKVVNEVVKICLAECATLDNLGKYTVHDFGAEINNYPLVIQKNILANGYRNLPEGISEINIGRYDIGGESWNTENSTIWVPDFTLPRLQPILDKKEIRLKEYTKCSEHWLLVWGEKLPNSYYNKVEFDTPVYTTFDKIFFVNLFKKEVFEINTLKPTSF